MTDTFSVISIAAFVRRNLPSMFSSVGNRKKREDFTNWISWNMGRMNVCVIPGVARGTISGVGIARSISNETDARFPYRFDERGDTLYVHLAVAKNHEGFRALLAYCKFRWPKCSKIMFYRKKNKKMTTYNFKRFLELVETKPLERQR
jgi:hypothetical protein